MDTAIYAGRKWNIPCIFEEVELGLIAQSWTTSNSSLVNLRNQLNKKKVRAFGKQLVQQYDAYTVVSEKERELLTRFVDGLGQAHVVPNGVDLEYYRPGLCNPQPNSLIFNGSLTFSANFEAMNYFLRDVLPLINLQIPEVTLQITGRINGIDLSRLPINSNVRLSDFIPDIRQDVASSWVCVVPLLKGGGTRLKILEAMALGTPVVATPKAAEGLEVIPNKHLLIGENNIAFAQQVVRILQDPCLRMSLAEAGRKLVEERYGWEAIGNKFEQLVKATVQNYQSQSSHG